jgi:WD40 repeat protein
LAVTGVGYTADSRTLATTYEDGNVRLWDLERGWEVRATRANAAHVQTLVFTGAGQPLLAKDAANSSEGVLLLDAISRQERGRLQGTFAGLTAAALAADERILATMEADQIRLWDVSNGQEKRRFRDGRQAQGKGSPLTAAALSPTGKWLAAGRKDGALLLWETSGATAPVELGPHRGAVTAVLFSPDERSIVSSGLDGCLRLWDVASRQQNAVADAKSPLRCLALCPGRRLLATGDAVGFVQLLDMDRLRLLATLSGPTAAIQALAFAPNGQTLCLGSAKGTVKIWRVAEVLGAAP